MAKARIRWPASPRLLLVISRPRPAASPPLVLAPLSRATTVGPACSARSRGPGADPAVGLTPPAPGLLAREATLRAACPAHSRSQAKASSDGEREGWWRLGRIPTTAAWAGLGGGDMELDGDLASSPATMELPAAIPFSRPFWLAVWMNRGHMGLVPLWRIAHRRPHPGNSGRARERFGSARLLVPCCRHKFTLCKATTVLMDRVPGCIPYPVRIVLGT